MLPVAYVNIIVISLTDEITPVPVPQTESLQYIVSPTENPSSTNDPTCLITVPVPALITALHSSTYC